MDILWPSFSIVILAPGIPPAGLHKYQPYRLLPWTASLRDGTVGPFTISQSGIRQIEAEPKVSSDVHKI